MVNTEWLYMGEMVDGCVGWVGYSDEEVGINV